MYSSRRQSHVPHFPATSPLTPNSLLSLLQYLQIHNFNPLHSYTINLPPIIIKQLTIKNKGTTGPHFQWDICLIQKQQNQPKVTISFLHFLCVYHSQHIAEKTYLSF